MHPLRIRRAAPADLDALLALEQSSFDHDRVSRAQWRRHLASASAAALIAETQDYLIGCALLFFRRGSRNARLYSIAIAQAARRHGIGEILLKAAEAEARKRDCTSMRLEVRTDNAAAIALYEKHGYARGRRIGGFYEDGADAWRYQKTAGLNAAVYLPHATECRPCND